MNKLDIKELFYHLQGQMTAKLCTDRKAISHPGTMGDASELNWIEWLRTYLPNRYSVDKAFMIDCEGNLSDQIDVVIYDQQYTPFVFKQDNVIYVPAESVYGVFEVKQDLKKEHIEYAAEKAESVRALKRTSAPIYHADGCYPPKKHAKILAGILTLSSSWKPALGESLDRCLSDLLESRSIDLGCALKSGSFRVDYTSGKMIIEKSSEKNALIFFFLKLFGSLQKIATVPAIDIECYAGFIYDLA